MAILPHIGEVKFGTWVELMFLVGTLELVLIALVWPPMWLVVVPGVVTGIVLDIGARRLFRAERRGAAGAPDGEERA